ncbi:YceD family protein [Candidatus Leptofilum sp.]|uniref:YceD family protein n=1 Tax=Candidatus Leptofilum sp. TaxID=3241576 RepID=UPI003B58E4C2
MTSKRPSRLRFNFGFFLEASLGTSRTIELSYPTIQVEDLTLSPLAGTFTATRTSEGVYLSGTLNSTHLSECVRCLEEATVPIHMKLDDLFYYPAHTAPEGEYSIGEDGFMDLAPLVRELTVLETPIQPVCRVDCQGLCMECGQNLNIADCGCEANPINERLSALQQLLNSKDN